MKARILLSLCWLLVLPLSGCRAGVTPAPAMATVYVTFDMGGGGAGFAALLYAQEVTSGKTFKGFAPAGSHGGVVLPTSPPVGIQVEAPGTYVFYAALDQRPRVVSIRRHRVFARGSLPLLIAHRPGCRARRGVSHHCRRSLGRDPDARGSGGRPVASLALCPRSWTVLE